VLKRNGLNARIKRKKPLLLRKHRQRRLAFAQKYRNWTAEDWKRVVWSDETKINLFGSDGRQWCYKRNGEPLQDCHIFPTMKYGGGSIMIWGCMAAQGVGYMCRIDGNMDGELYRSILGNELLWTFDWYGMQKSDILFQHDNDPKHTAYLTTEWLSNQGINVLTWPSQSPDLNPIEHLWHHVKQKQKSYEHPVSNRSELWSRFEEVWRSIDPVFCSKLVESMPKRTTAVLKAKGGHTIF